MKKLLLLLTAVLLPVLTYADDSGTCGENLTWTYVESTKTLTISGTGKMTDYYVDNKAPWYEKREQIISIIIEEGVTSIGNNAFCGCSGLTSITIPQGVTSISDYTFSGCSGLTSITIPKGVTSIGNYTFYDCI